jgi:predicted RNA methylase
MSDVLSQLNPKVRKHAFMSLLARSPERILAIRLAMSRVMRPNSVVLDAGCGSLGVIAIIAAKAGASRVLAVDVEDLDFARELSKENGVADRIEFIQSDLNDVHLPVESFDLMIGMIYKNDIEKDLPQQNLMRGLIERYAHADTVFIPNKVRYSVTGYHHPMGNVDDSLNRIEIEKVIDNVERYTGMTFSAYRDVIREFRPQEPSGAKFRGMPRNDMKTNIALLTECRLFTEICYNDRLDQYTYPESCSLPVIHPGKLNVVIWQQDLIFDDILIRSRETVKLVAPASIVEPGMIVTLHTGQEWGDKLPITIDGKMDALSQG